MKLFTKDIDKKLFAQFEQGSDLKNQMVVAKIFNPTGRGVWYILNSDPSDPDYLWAIVDLFEVEAGSVSRSELESIKVPPFRLPLERDMYFTPINAAELYRGLRAGKTYAEGGEISIEAQNKDMLLNYAEELEHHVEEFEEAAKGAEKVMPWVIAKTERASTDLSDVTHYLASENEKRREYEDGEGEEEYANGGEVKWQDAHYGDNALVVSENKMGIIIKPYGRKFHLRFPDGTEKTYDANELKFFKDMDDFDMGGEVEGVDLFEDYENIPEKVQEILDNYADAFEDGDYKGLEKANKALLKIGYTFEYGLDGQAYDLRKVGEKGKSESYARGGEITVKVGDKVKSKSGVDGEVYESTGTFFKLQDKYGNKGTKFYSTKDFKRSEIKSFALGGKLDVGIYYKTKDGRQARYLGDTNDPEVGTFMNRADGVFKLRYDEIEGKASAFADGGMMAKGGQIKEGDYFVSLRDKSYRFKIRDIEGNRVTIESIKKDGTSITDYGEEKDNLQYLLEKGYIKKVTKKEYWDEKDKMADGGMMGKGGKTEKEYKVGDKVIYAPNGKFFGAKNVSYIKKAEITDIEEVLGKKVYTLEFKNKFGQIVNTLQTQNSKEIDSDPDVKMASGGMMADGGELEQIKNIIIRFKSGNGESYIRRVTDLNGKDVDVDKDILQNKYYGYIRENHHNSSSGYGKIIIKNGKVEDYDYESNYDKGGKVKFADKVKSIKASLLERKKVSPKVQKDYGKTYSPKEAEESAKRIVGAMTAKERLMAKRKKGKK